MSMRNITLRFSTLWFLKLTSFSVCFSLKSFAKHRLLGGLHLICAVCSVLIQGASAFYDCFTTWHSQWLSSTAAETGLQQFRLPPGEPKKRVLFTWAALATAWYCCWCLWRLTWNLPPHPPSHLSSPRSLLTAHRFQTGLGRCVLPKVELGFWPWEGFAVDRGIWRDKIRSQFFKGKHTGRGGRHQRMGTGLAVRYFPSHCTGSPRPTASSFTHGVLEQLWCARNTLHPFSICLWTKKNFLLLCELTWKCQLTVWMPSNTQSRAGQSIF